MGEGHLYLGDYYSKTIQVASEADPTTWTALPTPPIPANGEGPKSMAYDETHHLLYAANRTGGVLRIVTP
jgi:hypothetical protein